MKRDLENEDTFWFGYRECQRRNAKLNKIRSYLNLVNTENWKLGICQFLVYSRR